MAKKGGDQRLGLYAKQLRYPKRQEPLDTPYYERLLKRIWEKLIKFAEPDKPVHVDLLWGLLPENKRVIIKMIEMLVEADRVHFDREKELVSVIFPEKK